MKYLCLLLFVCVPWFAQAQDSTAVQSYSTTLGIGDILKFGEKSVKFRELISDSRCPADVTCVWAGEAKILVEVFKNGESCGEEILVISGGGQGSVDLKHISSRASFTLSGFDLKPYPRTSIKLKPSDYTLTLEVKETRD